MREEGNMQAFQDEKWSYVKGTFILKNVIKVSNYFVNMN